MKVSNEDVKHVARLARLSLENDELDRYAGQLSTIISHIDKIAELDLEDVPPTSHVVGMSNVFREDEVLQSITQEEALLNGPAVEDGAFRVPPILEG
jgi:aspartyl-tRNA(Asn)/glutamyl-tRNA(Gln) amidotransferase subunit C